MAITKFKITRLPLRATILISGGSVPLNQEYHISQQASMTVDVLDRGVPYDDFGFKLGNDNGDWSPQYKATINALTNSNTPEITPNSLLVATNGQINITADIVINDSTDRVIYQGISNSLNGFLVINGSRAIIGQTYFLHEFIGVIFVSTVSMISQNVVTTLMFLPYNITEDGVVANIVITTTGNMQASIVYSYDETNDPVTGILT